MYSRPNSIRKNDYHFRAWIVIVKLFRCVLLGVMSDYIMFTLELTLKSLIEGKYIHILSILVPL